MRVCDKCGKKLGLFKGYKLYDEYGNHLYVCKECKELMFIDRVLKEEKIREDAGL